MDDWYSRPNEKAFDRAEEEYEVYREVLKENIMDKLTEVRLAKRELQEAEDIIDGWEREHKVASARIHYDTVKKEYDIEMGVIERDTSGSGLPWDGLNEAGKPSEYTE